MKLRDKLDALYAASNRREATHPDPVEFLYRYPLAEDREIVALLAASLAYGRVAQILKSIGLVLDRLGPSPAGTIDHLQEREMVEWLHGFKHRWTTPDQLADFFIGIKRMRQECGSLRSGFVKGLNPRDETVLSSLRTWVNRLQAGRLLSDPGKGSACKRLHLFLRWMVRRDEVDPGGWDEISPAQLVVPLDVHMHRIGRLLRMTRRKQANRATALEVTAAFRLICPNDPVKYDFALTRFGISEGLNEGEVRAEIRGWGRLTR